MASPVVIGKAQVKDIRNTSEKHEIVTAAQETVSIAEQRRQKGNGDKAGANAEFEA